MASEIRVNQIQNRSGLTTTTFTDTGVTIAGILTVSENLNVGGVLTYEDVTNVDAIGIVTARAGINLVGNDLNVGSNIKIGNASGIVTATSFSGSGANLTSLPAQATIANNADNRVITGGSGVNLNGEANVNINAGTLIVGHTASTTTSNGEGPFVQVKGPDSRAGASFIRHSADAAACGLYIGKSRNATIGSNTVVQSGDELGRITFSGDDGTDIHTEAAKIVASVDGTPGSNDMPGRLQFYTTADGAASPTERFRIDSSGRMGLATGGAPTYRLDIGDGANDPPSGYQLRINSAGDYIFALQRQSTPSFSIRNNGTSIVHLNTQNNKQLALGVSSGNASGSIAEDVVLDSSGNLKISNGNLRFNTAGKGIDFSATSDATGMTSELFDDYERGAHTFAVTGAGGNPTVSIDGSYNKLYYTKIGDMVHVTGEMRWTISSHGSGDLRISIPFTADSQAQSNCQGTAQTWNVDWAWRTESRDLWSEVTPGHNYMRFRIGGSDSLNEDYLDCGSSYQKTAHSGYGVEYQVSIWYRTG